MIGTAKEIAIEMLRDDDNDGEKFVSPAGAGTIFAVSALTGISVMKRSTWDGKTGGRAVSLRMCPLIYNIVEVMVEENGNTVIPFRLRRLR
jgi:hypothetical protein